MALIEKFKAFRKKNKKKPKEEVEESEMSFLDHLEELRWHLMRSMISIVAFAVFFFVKRDWFMNDIIIVPFTKEAPLNQLLCKMGMCVGDTLKIDFQVIHPTEQFLKAIMISLVGGLVLSFPYILWEVWRFIKPGLHPHEKKGMRWTVFIMSMLFFLGISFAYFVILPFSISFLANFQLMEGIINQWRIGYALGFFAQIVLAGGLLFEMPILAYFLAKIGVISPSFLVRYRRHAIVVLLLIAAVLTPPDVTSQILIFFPLLTLYQVSIRVVKVVHRNQERELAKEKAEEARMRAEGVSKTPPPDETKS